MNDADMGFRTAIVGGFNRDDVINYITKQTQTNTKKTDELKTQNDELKDKNEQLSKENDKLSKDNEELSERIKEMTGQIDKLKGEISDRESLVKLADDETAEQNKLYNEMLDKFKEFKEKYYKIEKENAALTEKVDELVKKTQKFDEDRAYIADIELEAHKRADEIEQKAKQKAQELIDDAETEAEEIKIQNEKTKLEYAQILKQTRQSITEAINKLEERSCGKLCEKSSEESADDMIYPASGQQEA